MDDKAERLRIEVHKSHREIFREMKNAPPPSPFFTDTFILDLQLTDPLDGVMALNRDAEVIIIIL